MREDYNIVVFEDFLLENTQKKIPKILLIFIQWVGYYEAKLAREASYREMMYDYLRKLRQQAGLGALDLSPDKPTAPAT